MTKLRYLFVLAPLVAIATWWIARETPAASAQVELRRPAVLVAPARVEPVRDRVELAFEATGRILAIEVAEGSAVTAGQVLARLDDRLARARVAAAEATIKQATARHALAVRGPRREELVAARADADAAAATSSHRQLEHARSTELGTRGAVASAEVDADAVAAQVATAHANAATARYRVLANGTRREQIEEAAALVALARADLEAARVALDQTLLRAPIAGVVLRRTAEVGELVGPTAGPVFALADLSELELRAEVDEADIAAVGVGQPAYATAVAYGTQRFAVRIVRITRELGRKTVRDDDPRARVDTRVLEVIARFDEPPSTPLPLGLRMSVHVAK